MATYYYPLIGGSMLASSVYHFLYFNGHVLGVSGIYGSSLSQVLSMARSEFSRSQPPRVVEPTARPISETEPLISSSVNPTNESSTTADGTNSPEPESNNWKLAFTAGLFCGGLLLRILRPILERRLGVPIFDEDIIQGISNSPLVILLAGTLVSIGTKVI
jgi:hypothetical protein